MKPLKTITRTIPAWAESVRLVLNGIDGYPPNLRETWTVPEFLAAADTLQNRNGGGEWDVLCYAVAGKTTWRAPYGRENRYRQLRAAKGGRVRLVADWSYMRWHQVRFRSSTLAA